MPVVTAPQEVQAPAIPELAGLPEEEAAVLSLLDSSLDISTTLPLSETIVETVPISESEVLPLNSTGEVTTTLQAGQVSLVEASGGTAVGLGGKLSLKIPPGAVQQAVEVIIRPASSLPISSLPPSGEPFEIRVYRQDTRDEIRKFDQPLAIELAYDESSLRGHESTLSLVYFDEQKQSWLTLPSYVDVEENVLHATTDHLTVFDVTYADWESSRLPGLQGFQVSPFTGAATYSLPLWTPPGPGGLQPSLVLRYNSQIVDNSIALRTQASWVGMGWGLDTGYIERNMRGTPYDLDDDTFSISVGGTDNLILKGEDGYYHTADESFWRIERLNVDQPNESWIARDKTGNTYIFGDDDNSRAISKTGFTCVETPEHQCTVIMGPWRWSLHKIINNSGKELIFKYYEDTELRMHKNGHGNDKPYYPDLWSYPSEIVYPNGEYRVLFDRDARYDYRSSWDDLYGKMLYQRHRLNAIWIMNGDQLVRRYKFSYTLSHPIYPNLSWETEGKTLTLWKVQEYGFGAEGEVSLPETTFTYDGMHLVEANNGYSGKVAFLYDFEPWHEQTTTDWRTFSSGNCVYQGGEYTTTFRVYEGQGNVECFGMSPPRLDGKGYLDTPGDLLLPGGTYSFTAKVKNHIVPTPITVTLSYYDGIQEVFLLQTELEYGETQTLSAVATPTSSARVIYLLLECSKCDLTTKIELLPTRYRVIQKKIYDGVNPTPQVFRYRYDEAATNDELHSAAAATEHPYIVPVTEFRGHAMTQEIGPDGRVEWRFFHQDDRRKGRGAVDIVGSEDFHADFSSDMWWWYEWGNCEGNTLDCGVTDLRGDRAFYLQGGNEWGAIRRLRNDLTDGDMVLAQFMVSGSSTVFHLGLYNESGKHWGIFLDSYGSLTAIYEGDGESGAPPFNPAVAFERDTWYVVLLSIDDQKFLARVWERDNPSNGGEYQHAMPSGQMWQTRFASKWGTAWLDAYSEGSIYGLDEQQYTVKSWATTTRPYGEGEYFTGLGINWVDVQRQKILNFEGDGEYAGKRASFEYDNYGNVKRKLDAEWDSGASAWRDYRIDISGYYTNTSGVYLVGLPGYTNRYRCENKLDGHCSIDYPDLPDAELMESSVWYLYDWHSMYSDPPTAGKLTGRRTKLYKIGTESYYLDQDYVYDEWGNRTQARVYRAPGTFGGRQTNDPQITAQAYDSVYHTYVVSETNAMGQTTTFGYDFDLGLPTSMTGPNGSSTTITVDYDEFGRLTEAARPGDESQITPTLSVSYHDDAAKFWIELRQRIDEESGYAVWRKVYNGLGELVQAQTASAELEEGTRDLLVDYAYDAYGNVVTQTVPYTAATWGGSGEAYRTPDWQQPKTIASYDLLGRPLRVLAPDQTGPTYRYFDRETWVTDALTNTTKTVYDAWGRVKQVVPALPPDVSYAYDAMDQLVVVTRGGVTTTIAYDMGGRKTGMVDPDMGSWSYTYDALGNLTRQTDARGQAVCLYYDKLNRLIGKSTSLTAPDPMYFPLVFQQSAGGGGMMMMSGGGGLSEAEEEGIYSLEADAAYPAPEEALPSLEIQEGGDSLDTSYPAPTETPEGEENSLWDGMLHWIESFLAWITPAASAHSEEIESTDSLFSSTENSSVRVSRLAEEGCQGEALCPASPAYDVAYGYDDDSEGNLGIGHRTAMTDTVGVTRWVYDARGQLVQEEKQVNGLGVFATEWGYNSAGLVDSMQYPGGDDGQLGEQVDYGYHNQLALESVEGDFPYQQSASYDAAGRMVQRVLGNQAVVNGYAYYPWTQQGGRLHQLTSGLPGDPASLQDLWYAYDNMGNVLSIQDYKMGSPQTQTFTYDDIYRLLTAQASGGSDGNYGPESYGYSSTTGNLESKAGVTYTYTDTNHAHAATSLSNGWTYQYNANGNMTERNVSGSAYNLAYDAENHLMGVTGTVTATFGYDGDGKRVLATQGVTTTVYVGNYYELSVSGGVTSTVKYYYAGGSRIAMRQNEGAVKWLLGDHLGSASVAANSDGSLSSRQGYKAWGETRFGGAPTKYQYTGQMNEQSIGLYYYGARWYDPALGRFVQSDTIIPETKNSQAWDRYAYVYNNPLRFIDPTGHDIELWHFDKYGELPNEPNTSGALSSDKEKSPYRTFVRTPTQTSTGLCLTCLPTMTPPFNLWSIFPNQYSTPVPTAGPVWQAGPTSTPTPTVTLTPTSTRTPIPIRQQYDNVVGYISAWSIDPPLAEEGPPEYDPNPAILNPIFQEIYPIIGVAAFLVKYIDAIFIEPILDIFE